MGWHSENTGNLVDLELSRFQKLRLFWGDANRRIFHALLQNGYLIAVAAAAEGGLPAFPDTAGVFDGSRMLQHAAGCCAVSKELRTILLTGDCHADGVFRHRYGGIAHQTVKTQARNVQHIRRIQPHDCALDCGRIVRTDRVFVVELAVPVTVHRHPVRHQRIEGNDLTFTVTDDLGVGVAPQEQVRHEGFPEHERTHLRVRLIVEKQIQRVVDGFLLATVLLVTVEVQRQTCHRFRQDADAGIHRRHLHGGAFRHRLAGGGAAKIERIAAPGGAVLGLIPGTEKPGKDTHIESPSFQINKRPRLS